MRRLILLVAFAAAGCGSTTPVPSTTWPAADYTGLAVLEDGGVVLATSDTDGATQMLLAPSIGQRLSPITIPPTSCYAESRYGPQPFGYGGLAFIEICRHAPNQVPPDTANIVAADFAHHAFTTLMQITTSGETENATFALSPDAQRAYYDVGSGVCSGIALATPTAAALPLPWTVASDGRQFRLDASPDLTRACGPDGQAASPTLDPTGKTLAFLASPASVGLTTFESRSHAAWRIFTTRLTDGRPDVASAAVVEPGPIRWSPDGKWLAFVGIPAGQRGGLWVLNVEDHSIRLITAADVSVFAWERDSQRLLVAERIPQASTILRAVITEVTLPTP